MKNEKTGKIAGLDLRAAMRPREGLRDGPAHAPLSVLQRHLRDMDAVTEFCRAVEDVMWRGDYQETHDRARDILPKSDVLAAVKSADAKDPATRAALETVSVRSEHREVRDAALEALSKA